jgi:hypothetical protein
MSNETFSDEIQQKFDKNKFELVSDFKFLSNNSMVLEQCSVIMRVMYENN